MNVEIILFYLFSSLTIFCGVMVISAKNPIHSVLYLILVFCNAAGLLILLETEFLAMIFLVVYVGAIAVLFLFVVMMINIRLAELNENLLRYLPIGGIVALIFLVEVFLIIDSDLIPISQSEPAYIITWIDQIESLTNIESLGELMYTHYFYLFLTASLILLVAMIGAIVLTMHHRSNVKRQEIYMQIARDFENTVLLKV
jgi:NADH:ubiquinone oxidoreductase subunit 6 (subunit J)